MSSKLFSVMRKPMPIIIMNHPWSMNAKRQLRYLSSSVTVIAPTIYPAITPMTTNECRMAIHLVLLSLGENSLTQTGP